jgi:hypothetical protein
MRLCGSCLGLLERDRTSRACLQFVPQQLLSDPGQFWTEIRDKFQETRRMTHLELIYTVELSLALATNLVYSFLFLETLSLVAVGLAYSFF